MGIEQTLSKRQQLELITSLSARGEVPLKLSYLGDGAERWVKIANLRTGSDGINSLERDLITKRVGDFLNTFDKDIAINIVDIGCGDGAPAYPIADELVKDNRKFTYIPIDISTQLLKIASDNFKSKYSDIEIVPYELDFELGNFTEAIFQHKSDNSVNLLLFLGSTLGNFSDMGRILTNFRDSMGANDYLLIGMELVNFAKIENLIPHYTVDEVVSLAYMIPEQIGIDSKTSSYEVAWNDKKNQIELSARMKDGLSVKIQQEDIELEKNEKILLARSVKFSEAAFTKLVSEVDLRNELLTVNKNRSYLLSLVQPTRYLV